MDDAVKRVLAEYDARAAAEAKLQEEIPADRFSEHRDEFLLAVGPEAGQLLNILAKGAKARAILEIGTSYGYSTIWLAEAARETGGRLITLEKSADKLAYARKMLRRAGLEAYVDPRLGDARDTIASLDGPFDFVLVDLWKELYIPCFDLLYPKKLSAGAFLAADNMIFPENYREQALVYRNYVRAKPGIQSVLLPVGHGIELSRYGDGTLS